MIPRPPLEQAGIPPHIGAGLKEKTQLCDCGKPATCTGWFVSVTGGAYEINNAMFLCGACAQELVAMDPGVSIRPLRPEPERKWEALV